MQKISTIDSILKTNKSLKNFMSLNNLIVATQADELTFYLESKNRAQNLDPVVKISMDLKFLSDGMLTKKFLHTNLTPLHYNKKKLTVFERQIRPVSAIVSISVLSLYLSILEEAPTPEKKKMDWEPCGVMRFVCSLHPTSETGFKEKIGWQCPEEFRERAKFCYFWLIKYDFIKKIKLKFSPKFNFGQGIYSGIRVHSSEELNNLWNSDAQIRTSFLHDGLYKEVRKACE